MVDIEGADDVDGVEDGIGVVTDKIDELGGEEDCVAEVFGYRGLGLQPLAAWSRWIGDRGSAKPAGKAWTRLSVGAKRLG